MIAIDIGNTNIVTAFFREDEPVSEFRFESTEKKSSYSDYGRIFNAFVNSNGVNKENVTGVVISSVVPRVLSMVKKTCRTYLATKPLVVDFSTDTGIKNCYNNPEQTGIDRIVNAVAAYDKYRQDVIVIDFGTATTFDYVSSDAEFEGGVITPGIGICAEALFEKASQLPRVDLICPENIIAKDTVSGMQAGIVFGYSCLVDGIVQRMKQEAGTQCSAIATGGIAEVIAKHSETIDEVDKHLTLKGLNLIFKRRNSVSGKKQG